MTDPLERLRGHEADVRPPSVASIRRRARRRQRRQQATVGSVAGLVAVLAVLALVTVPGDGEDERSGLATGPRTPRPERTPSVTPAPTTQAATGGSGQAAAPEGETDASSPAETRGSDGSAAGTGADRASSREGAEALEATVDAPDEPVPPGEEARFTLRVCNPSDEDVDVAFDDAQRYDFLVSQGEERVWTWSSGRAFAQVASSERWDAGACRTWTEAWSGRDDDGRPVSPGRYEVVGLLASDPERPSPPAEFCMGACP